MNDDLLDKIVYNGRGQFRDADIFSDESGKLLEVDLIGISSNNCLKNKVNLGSENHIHDEHY